MMHVKNAHVIYTRLRPGHLSVGVGDGSEHSEVIIRNLELRFWMRLLLLLLRFVRSLTPLVSLCPRRAGNLRSFTNHLRSPEAHDAQGAIFFCFFFVCAFSSYISGVHHFWVRFLRMWPFFNPTIKVVTFRLRGWCVLGVFLLPAFTRLGHERQDLLSPCDEMHVCTD